MEVCAGGRMWCLRTVSRDASVPWGVMEESLVQGGAALAKNLRVGINGQQVNLKI